MARAVRSKKPKETKTRTIRTRAGKPNPLTAVNPKVCRKRKKVDECIGLAIDRCRQFEDWYKRLGFSNVEVPLPLSNGKVLSNTEIEKKRQEGFELIYRPGVITYQDFMKAVGQGRDWTVSDPVLTPNIDWSSPEGGYWFWLEASPSCPRNGQASFDLFYRTFEKEGLWICFLEEYVIAAYFLFGFSRVVLDQEFPGTGEFQLSFTRTLLGTYFGQDRILCAHCKVQGKMIVMINIRNVNERDEMSGVRLAEEV